MHRFIVFTVATVVAFAIVVSIDTQSAQAQMPGMMPGAAGAGYAAPAAGRAYGQNWGSSAANTDWNRFYHYPYVYYPQNFQGQDYYKSSDSLYHRYPTEMRIPVYNKRWHNYYPSNRRFHMGHHFILDTF